MKTKLIKFAALALACIMFAGVFACSAAQNDMSKISIGSVGKVNFTLADYMESYNTYAPYVQYMSNLNETVKNQLINYGATLTRCYDQGIKLDEAEEQQLKQDVEAEFKKAVEAMTAPSDVTGEDAIYAAKLEAFKKQMKDNGYTEASYKSELEDNLRKSKLMEKLREQVNAEVEFGKEQVKTYFDEHLATDEEKYKNDPNAFATAYNSYIADSGFIPLYTPEGMFTVKQLLVQYENNESVSATVEGVFNDELNKKLDEVRAALDGGISLDDFVKNFVSNKDYNNDTVFVPAEPNEDGTEVEESAQTLGYRKHGYIMHEKLLSRYFDGFGVAACMLKYGEDWTEPTPEPSATPAPTAAPEGDASAEPTAAPTEAPTAAPTEAPSADPEATEAPEEDLIEKYSIKFYETTDGHKIAEVKTNVARGGIHFMFLNEELESGAATMDENNEEDPVYANIAKFYRQELENNHYTESLKKWVEETPVRLNNTYIDNFARSYLGIN